MKSRSLSACYFPTRVFLVDDKQAYLQSLRNILAPEAAAYEFYNDQHKALSYLKEYRPSHFIDKAISHPEEARLNHRNIDVNIKAIHQEIYNPLRFSEISVLAIDYSMPGLTGREICEKLKTSPIKKVMLTGEADDKLAIELLNHSIIDQFVSKATPEFEHVVNDTIRQLQKEYFLEQTQVVIESLMHSKEHQALCLQDPEFFDLFQKLFLESHGAEYYLLDDSGSYFFLSYVGRPSYLVVRTEEDMQTAEELIQYSDHPSESALSAIKSRNKLLFLRSDDMTTEAIDWDSMLYPAKKLNTSSGSYYYSYIKEPHAFHLEGPKIVSFKSYLESR